MSDPQPVPQRRTPRRAEAEQPDKPGQGGEREGPSAAADPAAEAARDKASADKLRAQSHDALKNVNTGYD